jgi:iron complex outermembrane receptor protein
MRSSTREGIIIKNLAFVACLLASTASPAFAQQNDMPTPMASEAVPPVSSETPVARPVDAGGLEDIVVTATRRSERLQDIPVAVTALTSSMMRAAGLADIRNLTQVVPGFFGGKNLGLFLPVVRGVGSNSSSAGDEANVATYIDGIYQPDPFSTYIISTLPR